MICCIIHYYNVHFPPRIIQQLRDLKWSKTNYMNSKNEPFFEREHFTQSNNAVQNLGATMNNWFWNGDIHQWRIQPKYRPRQTLLKVTEKKEFPLGKRKWIVTGYKSDCPASLTQTNTESLKVCTLTSPVTGSATISSSWSRYCNREMAGNYRHGNLVWELFQGESHTGIISD